MGVLVQEVDHRFAEQEAQLSQRDRAMLCVVIKYFTKSLNSFQMTPLSTASVSSYYSIETLSVSRTVSEI